MDDQIFEWTTRGDDFYFRPLAAPLDVVWVLPGRSDFASHLALEDAQSRVQPHIIPASHKIAKAYRGRTFWRFWPMNEGEELLVRPLFALLRINDGQSAQFAFPKFSDFDTANKGELADWRAAVEAPDSDLHIARRWQRLSETERINEIVAIRGGTWDELIRLIGAAFVLWAQTGDNLELDLTKMGAVSLRKRGWPPRSELIETRLEVLAEHWDLQRRALHDFKRYWRGCDAFGDPMDVPQPKFGFSAPSQHERLEALLLWRDWLRDKLPPPQIESLLADVS